MNPVARRQPIMSSVMGNGENPRGHLPSSWMKTQRSNDCSSVVRVRRKQAIQWKFFLRAHVSCFDRVSVVPSSRRVTLAKSFTDSIHFIIFYYPQFLPANAWKSCCIITWTSRRSGSQVGYRSRERGNSWPCDTHLVKQIIATIRRH
jgi:hypothetical protein